MKKLRVKIDNTLGELLNITCGVLCGTVLGPLLFIIFINYFLKVKNINIRLSNCIKVYGQNGVFYMGLKL